MNFITRKTSGDFAYNHHEGWFRVFRFSKGVEVWVGKRFYLLDW